MTNNTNNFALRNVALAAAALLLAGCATKGSTPGDPLESYNRAVFQFNDAVDRAALKPAATVYKEVTPRFVQTGVNNFFGNLGDIWSAANNLMQGKGEAGMTDFTRFTLNSTFGLVGLLDIASEAGLQKHNEDFGQTLGYWGMPSGPYFVLPLLGPSTVRDTAALPLDMAADPWNYVDPTATRNWGTGLRIVDKRAVLLEASNLVESAALGDRYVFIRDGYLQRRQSQVFDGEGSRKPLGKSSDEPLDAKGIQDAYADDPGPTEAPAAPVKPPVSSEKPSK